MRINLHKKPSNVTVIEGFPGFGLVGSIVTQFLLEHLRTQLIGEFLVEEVPPVIAIHQHKLVKPMGIYYSKSHNLVILNAIIEPQGVEWLLADNIIKMAEELKAERIISIEGVLSSGSEKVFFLGDKKLESFGAESIKESVIIGVTAALLQKYDKLVCLFAESHSALPDSRGAANIIKVLDKYLGLDVDYTPLEKQAEEFERKIKDLLQQSAKVSEEKERKNMSYLG